MKKILALVLVVCLALGCFVGCKDDKETKPTKKPTTTTSAPATTAPAEDTTTSEEPTVDPTEEPVADPTEEPVADPTEEPVADPTEEPAPAPAGDWEMPDNSEIDCLAFDFRGGQTSFDEMLEGWAYTAAGIGFGGGTAANTAEISGVDPDGANPGYLAVEIGSTDDYFYLYDFDVWSIQDYPIVKVVMKNGTPDGGFELFLFEQGAACSGNVTISGISASDTAFKTYYIDLRKSGASNTLSVDAHGANLDRDFSAVRFDFPGSEDKPGAAFDIQYIGFFSSLSDAKAYK